MQYIIPAIVSLITVSVIFAFISLKKGLFGHTFKKRGLPPSITESNNILSCDTKLNDILVSLETITPEEIKDKSKLAEITDSKVLSLVKKTAPKILEILEDAKNSAKPSGESNAVLYKAIIPSGAKLVESKDMTGALRGMYMGENGIKGHANLVAQPFQKNANIVSSATSAVMGAASMVVGQYYMSKISTGLETINDGLSKISDFQNNEYRSRVFSLVSHVKKITDFQFEIIENTEHRLSKITQLDSLEEECTQLLGQASLTLMDFANKSNIDYDSYEKDIKEAQNWFLYQKSIYDMLCRISELRYTLCLGSVSREECTALLPTYTHQIEETQKNLTLWHNATVQRLKIDTNEIRRKRAGIDGIIHFVPGLFNDNLNFKAIEESTVEMIKEQSVNLSASCENESTELFSNDVQLIIENDKIYYLPSND